MRPSRESRSAGLTHGLTRLPDGKSGKKMELGDSCRLRVFCRQPGQQLFQGHDQVGIIAKCMGLIEQFQPNPPATPLVAISIPGVIDEDPPHRIRSRRKEVPPTVELLIAK